MEKDKCSVSYKILLAGIPIKNMLSHDDTALELTLVKYNLEIEDTALELTLVKYNLEIQI